jgi:hypothetical protein
MTTLSLFRSPEKHLKAASKASSKPGLSSCFGDTIKSDGVVAIVSTLAIATTSTVRKPSVCAEN